MEVTASLAERLKARFERMTEEKQAILLERFGGDCWEDIAEEVENVAIFERWRV